MDAGEPAADDKAFREALAIAGRHKLPQAARTYTKAEIRMRNRSNRPVLFGTIAILILATLWTMFVELEDLDLLFAVGPYALAAIPIIGLVIFFWPRRGIDYRDPRLSIEADEAALTVTDPAGTHVLDYAKLSFTLIPGFGRAFDGIVLDSPLGSISLDNVGYKWGRTTAAAIVKKCDDAGRRALPTE
jgi:hypothetical protein